MDYSDSLLLLTGYSVVIVAGSLLGGWLPSVIPDDSYPYPGGDDFCGGPDSRRCRVPPAAL